MAAGNAIEILSVNDVHHVSRQVQRDLFREILYTLTPEEAIELVRQGFTSAEVQRFRDLVMRMPYT